MCHFPTISFPSNVPERFQDVKDLLLAMESSSTTSPTPIPCLDHVVSKYQERFENAKTRLVAWNIAKDKFSAELLARSFVNDSMTISEQHQKIAAFEKSVAAKDYKIRLLKGTLRKQGEAIHRKNSAIKGLKLKVRNVKRVWAVQEALPKVQEALTAAHNFQDEFELLKEAYETTLGQLDAQKQETEALTKKNQKLIHDLKNATQRKNWIKDLQKENYQLNGKFLKAKDDIQIFKWQHEKQVQKLQEDLEKVKKEHEASLQIQDAHAQDQNCQDDADLESLMEAFKTILGQLDAQKQETEVLAKRNEKLFRNLKETSRAKRRAEADAKDLLAENYQLNGQVLKAKDDIHIFKWQHEKQVQELQEALDKAKKEHVKLESFHEDRKRDCAFKVLGNVRETQKAKDCLRKQVEEQKTQIKKLEEDASNDVFHHVYHAELMDNLMEAAVHKLEESSKQQVEVHKFQILDHENQLEAVQKETQKQLVQQQVAEEKWANETSIRIAELEENCAAEVRKTAEAVGRG
ncbi:hypothetical protein L596_021785 [Steinernema carpocapsae]|uniref:Uncharacterized protein n=1 Tax=Steinernema carpocapsae TaxID=34508 RepID=A0A4U5MK44_STECR|nr:hypothetical protein L596_021785 [Steinernema carpocapsae]